MDKNILGKDVEVYCFDRRDGFGSGLYNSLNVSFGVGDRLETVTQNRKRVKDIIGLNRLVSAHQVHGSELFFFEDEPNEDLEVQGYDGLLTAKRGVGLMVQQADCQAIMLYDQTAHAVAALHCGWRGNVLEIAAKAVHEMVETYRSKPEKISALISPSLGPCCAEFINYKSEFPEEFHKHETVEKHFDLWEVTREQLVGAGLKPEKINCLRICTCCTDDYFSYRRSKKMGEIQTGRNCSVIVLR